MTETRKQSKFWSFWHSQYLTINFTCSLKRRASSPEISWHLISCQYSNSSTQMPTMTCRLQRDADIKIRLSAYIMQPQNNPTICYRWLDLLNFSVMSYTALSDSRTSHQGPVSLFLHFFFLITPFPIPYKVEVVSNGMQRKLMGSKRS